MWLIVISVLILTVVVAFLYSTISKLKVKDEEEKYRCKDYLLTKTEKNAFDKLQSIIKENEFPFMVFPKMRLTDFLWSPKENRNAYLKIQSKFVDFLIVKLPQLHPAFAIFITNRDNKAKMQSLEIIEPALNKANIKLIKINAKDVFSEKFAKTMEEELLWQSQRSFSKSSHVQNVGES